MTATITPPPNVTSILVHQFFRSGGFDAPGSHPEFGQGLCASPATLTSPERPTARPTRSRLQKEIVEAAQRGERDPDKLAAIAHRAP